MVVVNMHLKALLSLSIEGATINVANEAYVLDIDVCLLLFVSQLCKRIDNNSENDVQQNGLHKQEIR